jgi:hypothetical protein
LSRSSAPVIKTIVPERKEAIENVAVIGGKLVAQYSSTCRAGCCCSISTAPPPARSLYPAPAQSAPSADARTPRTSAVASLAARAVHGLRPQSDDEEDGVI